MQNKLHIPAAPDSTIAELLGHAVASQTGIDDCDLVLYPSLLREQVDIGKKLEEIARKFRYSEPVIVNLLSDYEGRYSAPENLLILRTSIRRSQRSKNEWPLPYLWEGRDETFTPCSHLHHPSIGFCGVNNEYRSALISAFSKDSRIKSSFIVRDAFWGGKPHDPMLMEEFWNNMLAHPFALAPRGAGNFSMRFYQALSAGRIPVLLNTDMVLPLEDKIDWHEAIIMEDTPEQCVEKVLAVWQNGEVEPRQRRCYEIYHDWLAHGHYLRHLAPELLSYANSLRRKRKPWWQKLYKSNG